VETVFEMLRIVRKVLVMSVNPGKAGQMYLPYIGEKVDKLLALQKKMNFSVYWDGACGADKIKKFAPKGVRGFILGTTLLFGQGKPYFELMREIRGMMG
jgi:ribulose-phosphate 3-epimerase